MASIEKLDFGYGRTSLFDQLNLTLKPNTIYGLLGKNGAGKTTLLKIITGLLKPWAGTVTVFGRESRKRYSDVLEDIFLVPEEFNTPALTVQQYQSVWSVFYPRFDNGAFQKYLTEFQVDSSSNLAKMSYGQKKKTMLAFAIATNCRLVLLDEPTNGLDIPAKRQFRRLVAGGLNNQRTFVISTHQVRDMESLIDPVMIIDGGRIVLNAGLDQLSRSIRIETGVDVPPADAIYSEEGISGHTVVTANHSGSQEQIDLEVLFNTAISNEDGLNARIAEVK